VSSTTKTMCAWIPLYPYLSDRELDLLLSGSSGWFAGVRVRAGDREADRSRGGGS
jgi:hypothetical protein